MNLNSEMVIKYALNSFINCDKCIASMLNNYDREEIWCYYIHSKLCNVMVTNTCVARTQFTDGLCINMDHKPHFFS